MKEVGKTLTKESNMIGWYPLLALAAGVYLRGLNDDKEWAIVVSNIIPGLILAGSLTSAFVETMLHFFPLEQ